MFLHITSARYIDRYKIELRFNNDRYGIVDLAESLEGKVFQPLQDLALFKQFYGILEGRCTGTQRNDRPHYP